jgi:hypothetical protein
MSRVILAYPMNLPFRVGYGLDQSVGEEPGAVLAQAPAFVLEAAFRGGGLQRSARKAARAIFGRVEEREMLAQDFFLLVSCDASSARIPVRHLPICVEHVDRVVGHALHQQTKLLLTALQGIGCRLPLTDVSSDLGEPHKTAVFGADGIDDNTGPEARAVLANSPPLGFKLSSRRCGFQCHFGQSRSLIFRGIEARKVLPTYLSFRISFEALRPRIPAHDTPVNIKHVDCIVANCGYQQLEALQLRELIGA